MSKSVGKVFGNSSVNQYGYEKNYLNYLNNYDTSNYDGTLNNMTQQALNMSQNLSSLPDYRLTAEGSDAARQRAEEATYQSYIDKLTPQYQQQTADLETSLANKGISIGSEAYQRAMADLQEKQNEAYNQAAYHSVLNGQNAFTQSLNNEINSGNFGNNAQQDYIEQIKQLLEGSVSGYQNQANIYNVNQGIGNRISNAKASGWQNFDNTINTAANLYKMGK